MSTVARFHCTSCDNTVELPVKSGYRLNAEAVTKRAIRQGWIADAFRKSGTLCPDCQAVRKAARSPQPEPTEAEEAPVNITTRITPSAEAPRKLNADQRLKVRSLLDAHFDDARGMYLDGYSDKRIGEEINVPWALIAEMREVAYGPIKIDQEILDLKTEIASTRTAATKLRSEIIELVRKAGEEIGALDKRIEALEGRLDAKLKSMD